MKYLAKINPFNSLFGRIFLWFWLTIIIIFSGNLWLIDQLSERSEVKPAPAEKVTELSNVADSLENVVQRVPEGVELSRLLNRIGRNNQMLLILIDPLRKEYIFDDIPAHIRPAKELINPLIGQSLTYQIRTRRSEFIGPISVTLRGAQYQLFAGRVGSPESLGFVQQRNPEVLIGIALLISAVLCLLFTWSLLKPIRQITAATYKMSAGDLTVRVGSAAERQDELGRLGRAFNAMAEQVESLLLSQKRFLADVSHELRSPLARLQVAIGIAQQQVTQDDSAPWQTQLARIEKESHRIEKMLARVIMLARLEGVPHVQKQNVNLNALLHETLADCKFEAEHLDKVLSSDIGEDLRLNADPELLHSAIENVLRNALKYAKHTISISAHSHASCVELKIQDDGSGVPEQDLQNIFKAFYRVSLSRNRDSGGTGLGLAIAGHAIAAHNGSIDASNIIGGGLLVVMRVPKPSTAV